MTTYSVEDGRPGFRHISQKSDLQITDWPGIGRGVEDE